MRKKILVALGGDRGRMGNVLKKLISEADDMEIVARIDTAPRVGDVIGVDFGGVDCFFPEDEDAERMVYVDFTQPDEVLDNIRDISEKGIDSVIGTTGWYDKMKEMKAIAKWNERRILYASNFSIGVNVLFAATEYVTKKLRSWSYDAGILELHNTGKKDSPSGTAQMLGSIVVNILSGKEKAVYERRNKRQDNEVDVLGGRVGSVTGWHRIVFSPESGDYERLILEHSASNRDAFGTGAIEGIRWIYRAKKRGKKPGVYEFRKDVLKL